MAIVNKSVLVAHSAEEMFDLVADVQNYPRFLPWCAGASVLAQTETGPVARIDINFRGVRAHFTTSNRNEFPGSIQMALRDGPFRRLEGTWRFHRLAATGAKVEFTLEYEFTTHLLEALIGPVFDHIANSFVDAFVKRADAIHGFPG